ncbi:hypothetical protein A7K93_01870 [Candidatus Methylacidiphilum fumarolicum]|nr:hypothetical protein A7K93_01870 [Candidatus Methylacidiphilum fumarolicum]TFE76131.1 hypothetical protein A7K72_00305 [Candidatus Methylacidiphilum fumarolicum]
MARGFRSFRYLIIAAFLKATQVDPQCCSDKTAKRLRGPPLPTVKEPDACQKPVVPPPRPLQPCSPRSPHPTT